MRASPPTHRGFTLLESIVVMGIMVVILAVSHTFLHSGVGFYINSVQSLEVQQQALAGLTRIVDEMENSNYDAILVEPSAVLVPVAPDPPSSNIIFPNIFSITGDYGTTEKGGPLWQSFVCYMPTAMPDGTYIIQRKIDAIPGGVDYLPDPLSAGRNSAFFGPRPPTGVIARNVQALIVVPGTDALDITLTVTFSQRTSDSMRIESRVFPRN